MLDYHSRSLTDNWPEPPTSCADVGDAAPSTTDRAAINAVELEHTA